MAHIYLQMPRKARVPRSPDTMKPCLGRGLSSAQHGVEEVDLADLGIVGKGHHRLGGHQQLVSESIMVSR